MKVTVKNSNSTCINFSYVVNLNYEQFYNIEKYAVIFVIYIYILEGSALYALCAPTPGLSIDDLRAANLLLIHPMVGAHCNPP